MTQLDTVARAIADFRRRPRPLRLECGVQHYAWGDPEAIPAIIGRFNPDQKPFAELWAGAHPDLPSRAIIDGYQVPLDRLMREASSEILGPATAARFQGELPFLLKILAAGKPLSIQAHPDSTQAARGFERENLDGLPLDAPTRNYRDPRHKPELLVALSEFYALRGFRPLPEIAKTLAGIPEFSHLIPEGSLDADALATLYGRFMGSGRSEVNALLQPVIARLEREAAQRTLTPRDRDYWILRAHREFSDPDRLDPGLFSIFLLNLIALSPGQGIFLPAGELHAYLQGVGIEIMANSNNVLRGGLTSKHLDPQELVRILSFRGAPGEIIEPAADPQRPRWDSYRTPVSEFRLERLRLDAREWYALPPDEVRIALVIGGAADIEAQGPVTLRIPRGGALLIPANLACRVSVAADTEVWVAKVPY